MARRTRRERAEEKRKKRVRLWMGGFIIIIMVLSTMGFIVAFYAPQNPSNAQGAYDFNYETRDNRVWVRHGGEEIPFYSLPQGVEVPDRAVSALRDAQVVRVAFNASDEQNLPYVELARWDFSNYLDVPTSGALLAPSAEYQFPVVSCANASQQFPVIQFENATRAGVSVNDSCVTLSGNQVSILYARDALLYEYYDLT